MKISDIINELQGWLNSHGDLDVYAPSFCKKYKQIDFMYYNVYDQDEEGNPLKARLVIET